MMAPNGMGLEERASTEEGYYRLAWSPAGHRCLLQRQVGLPGYRGRAEQ
jgi:hypothetical protein